MLRLAACAILLCGLTATAKAADEVKLPTEKVRIPRSLVDIEMVKIPAGAIEMPVLDKKGKPLANGDKATIQIKSIWFEKTELPWDAFDIYHCRLDLNDEEKMAEYVTERDTPVPAWSRPSRPYRSTDRGFGHDGFPAISIQYNSAQRFCQWLSQRSGKMYRLPTEAEWEYACRAGQPTHQLDAAALGNVAWFAANTEAETGDLQTRPVGKKQPNAWGLHDMLGNAAEWTTITPKIGVVKGGSYRDQPADVHCSARALYDPMWQMNDPEDPKSSWWLADGPHVGFRIVREE